MTKKRILIVDDEASFTRLVALNLTGTGKYAVRTENWAARALGAAREFHPDLVLLDVMMPQLDGGKLAGEFQNAPDLKAIPLVFLTAAVKKEEVRSRSGLIGGFSYLAKPVNLSELVRCIDLALDRQPAGPLGRQDSPGEEILQRIPRLSRSC